LPVRAYISIEKNNRVLLKIPRRGIHMDVLWTKNSGLRAFSIDMQVLTNYFLYRTQVTKGILNNKGLFPPHVLDL
jgi:hypothetical protein